VVVGDTPLDVTAAHDAGALCIGVPWGKNSRETLLEAGADEVVDAVDDSLIAVLNRMFG
jgi:phosphoglycolate phosphatase-like HAD superfamily hydrolase